MEIINRIRLCLQMFAEGGDGAGAGEGSTAEGTPATSGESLEYVQYGKSTPETTGTEAVSEDADAQFKSLIKGQYKEQYGKAVESAIMSRMKGVQAKVDKFDAAQPIFEALAQKYGTSDPSDINAILKAIDEDSSYYEDEALEKGLTVEQVKAIHKMERENADLKAQMREQKVRENADKIYAKWMEEGEATKAVYPGFDLNAEMQNEEFRSLVNSGVNVRTAYEVMHKDDIISGAMKFAVEQSERKLTNKIAANAARPNESGVNRYSSAVVKSDVSQLTDADMDEVIRRAARGERIVF